MIEEKCLELKKFSFSKEIKYFAFVMYDFYIYIFKMEKFHNK